MTNFKINIDSAEKNKDVLYFELIGKRGVEELIEKKTSEELSRSIKEISRLKDRLDKLEEEIYVLKNLILDKWKR